MENYEHGTVPGSKRVPYFTKIIKKIKGHRTLPNQIDQYTQSEWKRRQGDTADQWLRTQLYNCLATNAEKSSERQNRMPRFLTPKSKNEDGRPCYCR